jgi:hypothetical protein
MMRVWSLRHWCERRTTSLARGYQLRDVWVPNWSSTSYDLGVFVY